MYKKMGFGPIYGIIPLHKVCALFQFINFIVCAIAAVTKPSTVRMGYFAYRNDTSIVGDDSLFSRIGYYPAGEVHLKWISAAFFLWTCITEHLFQIYLHSVCDFKEFEDGKKPRGGLSVLKNFTQYIQYKRHNPVRWFSYSIGSMLMTLNNTRLAGEISVTGWMTMAGCNLAMILCGDITERYGNQWGFYLIGCIFGGIILSHDLVLLISAPKIPVDWVYIIIASNYAAYFIFAVIAGLECCGFFGKRKQDGGRFGTYGTVDRLYTLMSLASKISQGYQGVFALGGI